MTVKSYIQPDDLLIKLAFQLLASALSSDVLCSYLAQKLMFVLLFTILMVSRGHTTVIANM